MNADIKIWIRVLERLGEKVEIMNDEIIIHNNLVPRYVIETIVERIKKADTENKYRVTIKYLLESLHLLKWYGYCNIQ